MKNLVPKSVFLSNFLLRTGVFSDKRGWGSRMGKEDGGEGGEEGKEKDAPKQRNLTMLFISTCVAFRAWVLLQEKGCAHHCGPISLEGQTVGEER